MGDGSLLGFLGARTQRCWFIKADEHKGAVSSYACDLRRARRGTAHRPEADPPEIAGPPAEGGN